MLSYRPLPFVERIRNAIQDDASAQAARDELQALSKEFVGSPMAQLLAHALQVKQVEVLKDRQLPVEYVRGALDTLEYMRDFVWALLPDTLRSPAVPDSELIDGIGEPYRAGSY